MNETYARKFPAVLIHAEDGATLMVTSLRRLPLGVPVDRCAGTPSGKRRVGTAWPRRIDYN
jgi:hypothetical protein